MLSKKKTKELELQVWGYLKKNPDKFKESVAQDILNQIAEFPNYSPLCGYFCEDDCKAKDGEICPSRNICDNKHEIKYHNYVVGDIPVKTKVINARYDCVSKWRVE